MHFSLSKYLATQTSPLAFNVTLATGYIPVVANQQVEFFARDDAGNGCHFRGVLSGTTITRTFIYESTEPDDRMPTFDDATLRIQSVMGGMTMRERDLGTAIIGLFWQSNTIGTHIDSIGSQELPDNRIYEWLDEGRKVIAEHPLEHQSIPRSNSFGYGTGLAKLLYQYEGYRDVLIVAGARGGSGFAANNWNKGDPEYNHFVNKVNAAIAAHPYNQLIGLYGSGGEDDCWGDWPGSATAFQGRLDQFIDDVRADIVLNPIQGPNWNNRFPIVITEMAPAFVAQGGDKVIVNNVMKTVGQRKPYTACASSDGLLSISGEPYHLVGNSIRQQPDRLYLSTLQARGNDTLGGPVSCSMAGEVVVDGSMAVVPTVPPVEATLTGEVLVDGSMSMLIGNVIQMALAGEVVLDGSMTMLVGATPEMRLLAGTGITEDADGISDWADPVNTGISAIQTVDAEKPNTDASGNVIFIRANEEKMLVPHALLNTGNGYTIIAKINTSSTAGNQNILSTNKHGFYVHNASGSIAGFLNNSLSTIPVATTVVNDGTDHIVAVTVTSGGVLSLFVDSSIEASHNFGSLQSDSIRAVLGAFWNASPVNHFDGIMKRIELFSNSMTESEINAATATW